MGVDAERQGGQLTVGDDERITHVGRYLRAAKLDELPQLINVLLGDMTLVGPRPEVPFYVGFYTPEQMRVLSLKPGVTDPASIRFRNESEILSDKEDPQNYYIDKIMPEKIDINMHYASRASLISDVGVILRTLVAIVR